MGTIHRGWDAALGRHVAVKVLNEDLRPKPGLAQQLVAEARLMARLDHPGVVGVHSLGVRAEVGPWFAMKLVRGQTLLAWLRERAATPLSGESIADLVEILIKVCDALSFAHSAGVVHGDLKHSNVMIGAYGEAYLMDWGVATPFPAPPRPPDAPPRVMGTPSLMAPEQARGEALEPRTDVFGIGAMLYSALARRPPYPVGTPAERIALAVRSEHPDLDEIAPESPWRLREIARKAMAPAVEDRFGSIALLRAALTRWLRGQLDFPVIEIAAGEALVVEGAESDRMFIVQEGRFEVRRLREPGRIIREVGPGEVVGEAGVLAGGNRTASVVALEDSRVVVVSQAQLDEELGRASPWLAELVRNLGRRFHDRETQGS